MRKRRAVAAAVIGTVSFVCFEGLALAQPQGTDQIYQNGGAVGTPINVGAQGVNYCHNLGTPGNGILVNQNVGSISLDAVICGQSGAYHYFYTLGSIQSIPFVPKAYEIHNS